MSGFPQTGTSLPAEQQSGPGNAAAIPASGNPTFTDPELESALQLLVERAQYIAGATGAALALAHGDEMVCRASVGSGPAIGARLQVRSGLTGESIERRQLLRCDNAETDGRVNLESCRQLGIASIVVAPLVARDGQVRGLFELFSDHAYAFEERDLIALERMAGLTLTALDLAEKRHVPGVATPAVQPTPPDIAPLCNDAHVPIGTAGGALATPTPPSGAENKEQGAATVASSQSPLGPALVHSTLQQDEAISGPSPLPEAMLRVQKCVSCGFPVSEGRTLCLDCEGKNDRQATSDNSLPAEFVFAFLTDAPPADESWLANHVNLLAVLVLILSIIVAIVVFR